MGNSATYVEIFALAAAVGLSSTMADSPTQRSSKATT